MLLITQANNQEFITQVKHFYHRNGQKLRLNENDYACTLRRHGQIAAGLRLEHKQDGWYLLRSLLVSPKQRGLKLGHQLIVEAQYALKIRKLCCFPYPELTDYYADAGFNTTPSANLPEDIATQFARYEARGNNFRCMTRIET